MFVIDKRNKIILTKGDSATIFIQVVDIDGNEYEIKPTDTIKMTVRKTVGDDVAIDKVATPEHYIIIDPEDTSELDTGLFLYDIELTTEEGFVYTIVPTNYFQLTEEITHG